MKVCCFRRNEIIDDIYNRYPSFFERSDDLLIPEKPIERYLLIKKPNKKLEEELNKYIESLDRNTLEKEYIIRKAYNKFLNLTDEEKKLLTIFPNTEALYGPFGYISSRNEAVLSMPLDFWMVSEFEDEATKIDTLMIGHVLDIDTSDEYYKDSFMWNKEMVHCWCMYSLLFNEIPINILKNNYAKKKNIVIPKDCTWEEHHKYFDEIYGDLYKGIDNAIKEMKAKIMNKTSALSLFKSLSIDEQLQSEWISIIDKYCEENKIAIPYEWLVLAYKGGIEKLGYDISKILIEYNKYTYDLVRIIELLPTQLFDNREFMKFAIQFDGEAISRSNLYLNDEEIIRMAIKRTGTAITFLGEKYYKDENLMLLALNNSWGGILSNRRIRNYWKNNIQFAYKAIDIDYQDYKYFSEEVRNDEKFLKYTIRKAATQDGIFYQLYDYFSKENKARIDLVFYALKNGMDVEPEDLTRNLRDNDELAEYFYKNDPYIMWQFSKRIRKKYKIK